MTLERARVVLARFAQFGEDGTISHNHDAGEEYRCFAWSPDDGDVIMLDDDFTLEELEAIVTWVRYQRPQSATPARRGRRRSS